MASISLGPLSLSFERFAVVAAWFLLVFIVEIIAKRSQKPVLVSVLYTSSLVAFVTARLVFAFMHGRIFLAEPWTLFYIWQGGFASLYGLVAGVIFAIWRLKKDAFTLLVAAAFVLICYSALLYAQDPQRQNVRTVEGFSIESLRGQQVALADIDSPVRVINLWATWCPPCQRELPMLLEQAAHYNSGSEVTLILLNQGQSPAEVTGYLARKNLAETAIYLDPSQALANSLKLRALPSTLFVNAQGEVYKVHVGELSKALLEHYIEASP